MSPRPAVGLTIGNFDGVHLGHRALLETLAGTIRSWNEPNPILVVMSFYPHPRQFFLRSAGAERSAETDSISSFRTKVRILGELGCDVLFAPHFSKRFASLSPEEFVQRFIVDTLHARTVVVGDDWAFGKARTGTWRTLRTLGEKHGFQVSIVPDITIDEDRVSSRAVRAALQDGKLDTANQLLGRDFELVGRVRRGASRGRMIGFPTANLEFRDQILPQDGVYATLSDVEGRRFRSVTNIGLRPTFEGSSRVVETHLIGDEQFDIYGKRITVTFIQRLRGEQRFPSMHELQTQIARDKLQAENVLRFLNY